MLITLKLIYHLFLGGGTLLEKIILLSLKVCRIYLRGDLVILRICIGLGNELSQSDVMGHICCFIMGKQ